MKIKTKIILISTLLFSLIMTVMILGATKDLERDYLRMFRARSDVFYERIISLIKVNKQVSPGDIDFSVLRKDDYKLTDYLISLKGKLVSSSLDKKMYQKHEKLINSNLKNYIYDQDDEHFYLNSYKFKEFDIKIIDYSDFLIKDRRFHRRLFFVIIPVYYLISFLIIVLVVNLAFRPVTKMMKTLRRIKATNLHQRIPLPKAKDELYHLGDSMNEMLESLEKSFESQKQFIADASHELRTPLTIMRMELELLAKDLPDQEHKESLESVLAEIERLNSLCNDLMTSAKLESGQYKADFKKIYLDEVILDVMQKFSTNMANNISFIMSDRVSVKGDYKLLYQVFFNLLDNARKYGDKNVKVKIELISDPVPRILITDNGPGIKEGDLKNLFNRFFRSNEVKAKTDGSGLGLSIVKEILDLHQAKIKIDSKFGEFTRVEISYQA